EIVGNQLHNVDEVDGSVLLNSTNPALADYYVEAVMSVTNALVQMDLIGRFQDLGNFYYIEVEPGLGQLQIRRVLGGVNTPLANASFVGGIGDHVVRLALVGSILRAYVDGVLVGTAIDSSLTVAGQAGVRMGPGGSGTSSVTATWKSFV